MIETKAPGERLDYAFGWGSYLQEGESLSSSTWEIEPAGELSTDEDSIAGEETRVWLLGGVTGHQYRVVNTVHTNAGRVDTHEFLLHVL